MEKTKVILITNDDGIHAPGILALRAALSSHGRILTVAPDREMSATSHSITLHKPLRMRELEEDVWSVDGTPTDCILLGVHRILKRKPDMIVSGINHGPNMGDDVSYSGTVAAAAEGAILGIPSVSISVAAWKNCRFEGAAQFAARAVGVMSTRRLSHRTVLNVNVPNVGESEVRGVKITKLGRRVYRDTVVEKVDPRGKTYYWIGGDDPTWEEEEGTDFTAVKSNMISVTPIKLDLTEHDSIDELESWKSELWRT